VSAPGLKAPQGERNDVIQQIELAKETNSSGEKPPGKKQTTVQRKSNFGETKTATWKKEW